MHRERERRGEPELLRRPGRRGRDGDARAELEDWAADERRHHVLGKGQWERPGIASGVQRGLESAGPWRWEVKARKGGEGVEGVGGDAA